MQLLFQLMSERQATASENRNANDFLTNRAECPASLVFFQENNILNFLAKKGLEMKAVDQASK